MPSLVFLALALLCSFFENSIDSHEQEGFILKRCREAEQQLAFECLPYFLALTTNSKVLDKMFSLDLRASSMFGEGKMLSMTHLLWSSYVVQSDVANWICSLITVAEALSVAISVADMNYAGVPLIYVNEPFTKVTGYSRAEAYGRNCRFLQGPGTQLSTIRKLSLHLRRGASCIIELLNYHKSGDAFRNLLCMRPIHDSNKVYRFCIGIQLPIDDHIYMQESSSRVIVDDLAASGHHEAIV